LVPQAGKAILRMADNFRLREPCDNNEIYKSIVNLELLNLGDILVSTFAMYEIRSNASKVSLLKL
jgi:hypothetical protein